MRAEFREEKLLALLEAPLVSEGMLYFVPPSRMARITTRPGASALVIDGGRLSYTDEAGASDVDLAGNRVARTLVENFVVLFGGDLAALRERYDVEFERRGHALAHAARCRRRRRSRSFIASVELRGDGPALEEMVDPRGGRRPHHHALPAGGDGYALHPRGARSAVSAGSVRPAAVSRLRSLLILLAVLGALTIAVATRLSFGTNITNLMPEGSAGSLADVSRRLAESDLARSMVLNVGAPDTATAVAGARALAEALARAPGGGVGADRRRRRAAAGDLRALLSASLLLPGVRSRPDPRAHDATPPCAPRRERARRELSLPTSSLVQAAGGLRSARELPGDPRAHLGPAARPRSGGRPVRHARRPLRAWCSSGRGRRPSTASARRRCWPTWIAAFAQVNERLGGALVLERSGANVFAVATERSIRSDVNFVTAFSIVSVFVCFQLFFRSWRNLLITGLPMLGGLVVATGLGMLVFGQLDGLTLGFGAALIGVVIDYPTHLLCHLCFSPHRARPALACCAGSRPRSRSAGSRRWRASPGWASPPSPASGRSRSSPPSGWASRSRSRSGCFRRWSCPVARVPLASRVVSERLGRVVLAAAPRRKTMAALAFGIVALCAPLLPRLVWVDDMSKLWRMDPSVVEEDRRVRERVSQWETGRLVIGVAPDREQAVALGEAVYERLAPLVASGELGGMRSLHTFLWPEARQRENLAALRADAELPARVRSAFEAAGFRGDAFAEFERSLAQEPPPPLRFEDLSDSPLADLVRPLLVDFGGEIAVNTYLQGVKSPQAVRARHRGPAGRALLRPAPVPERRLRTVPDHERAADLHGQSAGDRAAAGALSAPAPGAWRRSFRRSWSRCSCSAASRRSASRPTCCTWSAS